MSGGAQAAVVGRLQEAAEHRAGLQARLDEVELQRLALEHKSQAIIDWFSVWGSELGRVNEMTYTERRAWLRRLGVEVTVAKPGSDLPRYEIALNIPVDIREQLLRDPEGEFVPLTPEDEWHLNWESLYERQEPQRDPNPTQGSQRRLTWCGQ